MCFKVLFRRMARYMGLAREINFILFMCNVFRRKKAVIAQGECYCCHLRVCLLLLDSLLSDIDITTGVQLTSSLKSIVV